MKVRKNVILPVGGLIVFLMMIILMPRDNPSDYSVFCDFVYDNYDNPVEWHLVIYLDVDACLSCTEDMAAWVDLEKKLPDYYGILSIWAPPEDSFDVAYAMELEGLTTPVHVVDRPTINSLGWTYRETPIKILFDNECQPKTIIYASTNIRQSMMALNNIIAEVSSNWPNTTKQ